MKKLLIAFGLLIGLGIGAQAATISSSWTENQTLQSTTTIAAGGSQTDDIDLANSGYIEVSVTIEVDFGASTDNDVTVEVFASNNSGTDDDTIAVTSFSIADTNSTTKRVSFNLSGHPYIAVKVTNNDSADQIGYLSYYSGLKYSSQ